MPEAAVVASGFNWAEVIGQFGLYSILAWYLYYNTSIAIPRLMERHEQNHAAAVKQNNDTVREIVSTFDARLKTLDDSRSRDREALLAKQVCQAFHPTQTKPQQ